MLPDGFGYLVPSGEKKDVLGVLIESNVFVRPSREDHLFIRMMLGGAHHPEITKFTHEELIIKAIHKANGVKKNGAKLLGITFRSMRYRIDKYGLGGPGDDELDEE